MKAKYEQPVTVGILQILAWIGITVGAICLIAAMGTDKPEHVEERVSAGSLLLSSGIGCLILGMVLDGVLKTAFYAERTAELLEKMETERTVAAAAQKYSAQPPPMPAGFSEGAQAMAAQRFFVERPGGEQMGPLSVADLQSLLNREVVTAETMVLREGEEEWRPLGVFISSPSQ